MKAIRLILPSAALSVMLAVPAVAAPLPGVASPTGHGAMLVSAARQPAFLGVFAERVPADVAATLPAEAAKGVLVRGVAPDSPAAKAGIAPNDIILQVGDTPVGTRDELIAAVRKLQAGQEVKMIFLHKGARTAAKVALAANPLAASPAPPAKPAKPERPAPAEAPAEPGFLGVAVVPVPAEMAAHFGFKPGQAVWIRELAPDGPAAKAGLHVNDIILKAAGQPVGSLEQLARIVAGHQAGQRLAIDGIHQGKPMTVKATLGRREAPPAPKAGADASAKAREAAAQQRDALREAAEERAREMQKARKAAEDRAREMEKSERQRQETRRQAAEAAERARRQAQATKAMEPRQGDEELLKQIKALGEQIERLGQQVEKLEREKNSRR